MSKIITNQLTPQSGDTITVNGNISVDSGGIVVGTALTINQTGIDAVGVITAASFKGDGSNLSNLDIPAGFNELDSALFN